MVKGGGVLELACGIAGYRHEETNDLAESPDGSLGDGATRSRLDSVSLPIKEAVSWSSVI